MSYTGITAFLIALPHILYAAIWYQPQIWRAQFRGLSVEIFSRVASALKGTALQHVSLDSILNSQTAYTGPHCILSMGHVTVTSLLADRGLIFLFGVLTPPL